jgi:hypothetical protein
LTSEQIARAEKTSLRRWLAAGAALAVVAIAAYVMFFAYPEHVERARNWRPEMPAEELKSLREKYQPKNLTFSTKACPGPESMNSRLGVLHQTWKPDGTLTIAASVAERCAVSIPVGKYSLEGAKLLLEYVVYTGKTDLAACNCVYDLEYAITGLEKRSYEIEFANGRR